ncbi:putative tuberous sclerosis 2 isoform 3 [Operophtera brumata]|uniref:Putative tuberous sclerosis 2 isoform 3 n=1 Tax=Operophtera brumata TaxID=104452 RepID=A0A0L7LRT9_OPEBR|nr:putative tuberous sclerosis 2 isoform 3 [Operophtera brumata]
MYVTDVPVPPDADTGDLRLAVAGLLQLLHDKLLAAPAALPLRCFLVLLDHLDHHYKRPALFQHHAELRLKIFDMLFGLRANSFNCVGFCYDVHGAPVSGAASLRMKPLCSPFLTRALAVGRRAQDLDVLASTLCSMVSGWCWDLSYTKPRQSKPLYISDRSLAFPECLRGGGSGGQKLLVSEFHSAALPGLASMAPYHSYLEPQTQQRIVRCLLKYGMVLRSPQPYINALTIFTLETRDTMVKMLPEVLLDLSKISDTQAIASPMLEFLSTLTRLPKVFASFVEDQYMSVFAILLPYTNPSRYNHFVVSLAHHVIAAWFLKCRLSYRRNFVRFIIHGLHNYIIMPFEEQLHSKTNHFQQGAANEDSSNRQRSSSLLTETCVDLLARYTATPCSSKPTSASAAFHVELTETCVDLLARYTATPCSSKPTSRPGTSRTTLQAPRHTYILSRGGSASAAFHVELTETCVDLLARYTATPCSSKPTSASAAFHVELTETCVDLLARYTATPCSSKPTSTSAAFHVELMEACVDLLARYTATPCSSKPTSASAAFHVELTETCVDLLARYTATPCSSKPTRSETAQFLFDGGQSTTWLVGHKLVTITTSGCHQNSLKQGLCDSYSKWSLQHSRSTDTCGSLSLSELQPGSGHTTRQNSSENSKATDPLVEILNHFTQRFERISKEVALWWRGSAAAGSGACACWCAQWAELHVRAPTGDVCWLMRLQNQSGTRVRWGAAARGVLVRAVAELHVCVLVRAVAELHVCVLVRVVAELHVRVLVRAVAELHVRVLMRAVGRAARARTHRRRLLADAAPEPGTRVRWGAAARGVLVRAVAELHVCVLVRAVAELHVCVLVRVVAELHVRVLVRAVAELHVRVLMRAVGRAARARTHRRRVLADVAPEPAAPGVLVRAVAELHVRVLMRAVAELHVRVLMRAVAELHVRVPVRAVAELHVRVPVRAVAELHVRVPVRTVAELPVRVPVRAVAELLWNQTINLSVVQMNWDYLLESPLQDVAALLNPTGGPTPSPGASPAHTPAPRTLSASSGLGDSRQDDEHAADQHPRLAAAPERGRRARARGHAARRARGNVQRRLVSYSETRPRRLLATMSTQPINIPGSPQRQSVAGAREHEDMLLVVPEALRVTEGALSAQA